MATFAWQTPDFPAAGFICRRILIPNSTSWLAIVNGALLPLTNDFNWEQNGAMTPQQAADMAWQMFNKSTDTLEGQCRMVGELIPFAGAASPDPDWLVCDGTSLARAAYPDLFGVIGTLYGAADGAHFNIPDLQGRVAMGAGTGSGLSSRSVGQEIGEETHVITVAESANHTHTDAGHTHAEGTAAPNLTTIGPGAPEPTAIPSVGVTGVGSAALSSTGGNAGHNNIQPSTVINWLIVTK